MQKLSSMLAFVVLSAAAFGLSTLAPAAHAQSTGVALSCDVTTPAARARCRVAAFATDEGAAA